MTELFPVQGVVVSNHHEPEPYTVVWSEQFNFSFILLRDVMSNYRSYLNLGTLVEYHVEILDAPVECFRRISTRGHELRPPEGYRNHRSDSHFKNTPRVEVVFRAEALDVKPFFQWRDSFVLTSTQDEDNLYIAKGKNLTAQIALSDALELVASNICFFTAVAEMDSEALGDAKYFWKIKDYVVDGKACSLKQLLEKNLRYLQEAVSTPEPRRKLKTLEKFARKEERLPASRRRNFSTAVMKPIMTRTTDISFKIPDTDMSIFLGLVVNFDMVWIVYSLKHSEFVKIDPAVDMKTGRWYNFRVYSQDPCSCVLTSEHFVCDIVVTEPPNTCIRFLPSRESSRSGLVILVTVLIPRIDDDTCEFYFDHPIISNMMSCEDVIAEAQGSIDTEVIAELTCLNTGWEVMKVHKMTSESSLTNLADPFFVYEFQFYDEYIEQLRILEELQELKEKEKRIPEQKPPPIVADEPLESTATKPKPKPTLTSDLFSYINRLNMEADKKLGVVNALTQTLVNEKVEIPSNVLESKTNYLSYLRDKFNEKTDIDERLKLSNALKPTVCDEEDGKPSKRENHIDSDSSSYFSLPSSSRDQTDYQQADTYQAETSQNDIPSSSEIVDLNSSIHFDERPSTSAPERAEFIQVSEEPLDVQQPTTMITLEGMPIEERDEIAMGERVPISSSSCLSLSEDSPGRETRTSSRNSMKPSSNSSSFFPRSSRSKRVMKSLKTDDSALSTPRTCGSPSDQKCELDLVQRQLLEELKLSSDSEEELQTIANPDSPLTPPPYIPLIGEEIMDDSDIENEEPIGTTDEQRFAVGLVVKSFGSFVLLYSPDKTFHTILVKHSLINGSPFEKAGYVAKLGTWMKIAMVQPRRPRGKDVEHPPEFSHIAMSPPEPFDIQAVSLEKPWRQRFFNGIFETYQTAQLRIDKEIPTVMVNERIFYHIQSVFTVWILIPMERLELLVQGGFSNLDCKLSFWVTRLRCEQYNALFLCDNQPIHIEREDGTTDELRAKFGLGVAEEIAPDALEFCLKSLPPLMPKSSDESELKKIVSINPPFDQTEVGGNSFTLQDPRTLTSLQSVTPNATSTPVASDGESSTSDISENSNELAVFDEIDYPDGDLRLLFLEKLSILFHPRLQEVLEEQELQSLMPYISEWIEETQEQLEL